MIDLDNLQAAAEAATPGPWERSSSRSIESNTGDGSWTIVVDQLNDGIGAGVIEAADATFIATMNPAMALELVAAHRAALDRIARVEALHQPVDIEPSETICGHCSYRLPNGRYLGKVIEWPCPTVRALTEG